MRRTIEMTWVGAVAAALACAAEPTGEPSPSADDGTTGTPAGTVGTSTDTGAAGDETTAGGSTGTSSPGSDDAADDGSPIGFDLGNIPDVPANVDETCVEDVDVVFVMDVSTTMGGFLSALGDEILAVDAALQSYNLPSDPHYGLVVFVDDFALLNAGAPYADANALQDDFVFWADFTSSNQQVSGGNSNSTWPENSIDALHAAATGFQWRDPETTSRIIIHTTDDTFWDGPTTGNGIPIVNSYVDTVDALQAEEIRVYSFADDIGGSCNCLDVTPGWSTPYMAETPVPEATDGAVYEIAQILSGMTSLSDAITASVEDSICNPYTPVG
ncbi:MAG: hypothetical protein AAF721_21430 [Myxococcota bacterium]